MTFAYCQIQKTVNTWKISGMLIVYWPITIKFRTREQTSKPQTNYRCCLLFSYLAPYWLISRNTITFHKYFWCSRFCEFHSKQLTFAPLVAGPLPAEIFSMSFPTSSLLPYSFSAHSSKAYLNWLKFIFLRFCCNSEKRKHQLYIKLQSFVVNVCIKLKQYPLRYKGKDQNLCRTSWLQVC